MYSCNAFAQALSEKFVIFKFAPFKLIAVTPNVSLSVERRFNNKFSAQIQTDYIFNALAVNDATTFQDRTYRGFRIFPEARFYYNINTTVHPYFGIQAMYKYTNEKFGQFRTEVDGAGQTYMRLRDYRISKSVVASNGLIGWLLFFTEDQRASFDINFGLGFRSRWVDTNYPASSLDDLLSLTATDANLTISAACNIKFGYTIFK